ncbi:MAG: thioredoxin family protein [Bacteroidia bacterium]|nr:thioredoxin family protein [Bacteroidia bacterium]MBT8229124.1 thioredoxin family protein [Bacteroidia bacterium]
MKGVYVLILLFLISVTGGAQGIEFFEGSWKEAVEQAKSQEKIVFIDAYATWCGPCKRMAKNVFTKSDVGDFFNKNFINLKLDMEKTDGLSFGQKYPVSAYPTLYFVDGKGKIVKKAVGGQTVESLLDLAKTAIKSHDTSGDFKIKYDEGNRDYELVYNYVKSLNKVGKPSLKISNDYLKSDPDISDEQKAAFLLVAVIDSDSRLFDQLIELKTSAIKSASPEVFQEKVYKAAFLTIKKSVDFDYPALFETALDKYKSARLDNYSRFEQEAYMEYHKLTGDYQQWKKVSEKYLKKYGKKESELYPAQITVLRNNFKFENDALNYACELGKEMVKRDDSANNYNYYIQLLMTNKDFSEARKVLEDAIKKCNSRNENIDNLERMKDYLDSL